MFDQPTILPSVRARWAISREVVVFPLVPVTATTGTRGVIVCGVGPGAGRGTRSAASLTACSTSAPGRASSTSATARPITWARSRCTHGNATTIWWGSFVGRTRTASRVVPDSEATARTSRATARTANRCRNPDSAAPGRAFFSPIRLANRAAVSSEAAARVPMSRVSLMAARGK